MHWEIHHPRPSRFPLGGDFAPLGPRDFPRALPSGNLSGLGKSLGRRGWIFQYLPRFGGARIQHLRPQDFPRPSRPGNVKILKRKSNSVEQPAASRGIKSGFRTILRLNWWLVGGRWGGRGASGEGGRREQLGDSNSSLNSKFL